MLSYARPNLTNQASLTSTVQDMHYAEFAEDEVNLHRPQPCMYRSCMTDTDLGRVSRSKVSSTPSRSTRTTNGKPLARRLANRQRYIEISSLVTVSSPRPYTSAGLAQPSAPVPAEYLNLSVDEHYANPPRSGLRAICQTALSW